MRSYRGHFGTRGRRYSTTLTAFRQARADERANQARALRRIPIITNQPTARAGRWHFADTGYTPGQALVAAVNSPEDLAG